MTISKEKSHQKNKKKKYKKLTFDERDNLLETLREGSKGLRKFLFGESAYFILFNVIQCIFFVYM